MPVVQRLNLIPIWPLTFHPFTKTLLLSPMITKPEVVMLGNSTFVSIHDERIMVWTEPRSSQNWSQIEFVFPGIGNQNSIKDAQNWGVLLVRLCVPDLCNSLRAVVLIISLKASTSLTSTFPEDFSSTFLTKLKSPPTISGDSISSTLTCNF